MASKRLVKCPHCGMTFENKQHDDPLASALHSLFSAGGEKDTSPMSAIFGIQSTKFECPHCQREFNL